MKGVSLHYECDASGHHYRWVLFIDGKSERYYDTDDIKAVLAKQGLSEDEISVLIKEADEIY